MLSDEVERDARGENGDEKRFLQLALPREIGSTMEDKVVNGQGWNSLGSPRAAWSETTMLGKKMETRTRLRRVHVDHSEISPVPVDGWESWRKSEPG